MRSKPLQQSRSSRTYIFAFGAALLAVAIVAAAFVSRDATIFGDDAEPTPTSASAVDDVEPTPPIDSTVDDAESDSTENDADEAASSSDDEAQSDAEPDPVAFANCMRANGIPDFPDPQPSGGFLGITPDMQQNPNMAAASEACAHLRPEGRTGDGAVDPEVMLAFAQCMRENGVPDFPDPGTTGGGAMLGGGASGSGIDTNSPRFQAALELCGDEYGISIMTR